MLSPEASRACGRALTAALDLGFDRDELAEIRRRMQQLEAADGPVVELDGLPSDLLEFVLRFT